MVTWSFIYQSEKIPQNIYVAILIEAPWTMESCVESIVVKLKIHRKVTLRVLVLNFHSWGGERLYKQKRLKRLLAAKAVRAAG